MYPTCVVECKAYLIASLKPRLFHNHTTPPATLQHQITGHRPKRKPHSMTSSPAPKKHIAHTLLSRAHSPDTATQQFTERIKQKPLFLRATSPSASDNRDRRRKHRLRKKEYFLKHQRPQPLSAREKRSSGLYDLPKEECRYSIFKGLHALWVGYMQEILDLKIERRGHVVTPSSHGAKLVSADYHGAEVEVVRSGCASRVGVKGIVVRDTKFTFVVVTAQDQVKSEFVELGCRFVCLY